MEFGFSRKAAITKFGLNVSPKFIPLVKVIAENSQLVHERKKLSDLQEQKKVIVSKVDIFFQGPHHEPQTEGGIRPPGKEADAQALLSGVAVAELTGQSKDTEYRLLIRQREALDLAVKMQENLIQQLEFRLIREGLADEGLKKWKIENEIMPEIALCEKLINLLKQKEVDNAFLNHAGYQTNLRPPEFLTSAYEQFLLFGGNNFRDLQGHIDWLKTTWAIPE